MADPVPTNVWSRTGSNTIDTPYYWDDVNNWLELEPHAFGLLERARAGTSRPDVLCIYYPEWHVYPEGERIFGKGRSEWDFVNTAVPRFPGHYQPIVLEAGYDSASSYNVTPYDFDDNDVGRSVVKGTKQVLTHEEFALAHSQYNARIAKASRIPYIPVATRGWDCSPRCRTDEPFPWKTLVYPYYGIVGGLKPEIYREILSAVRRQAESDPLRPNAILINAWNEYTEGCYLMPDRKDGRAYLEATKGVTGWKTK